ncbi:hypothetical protein ACXHP7_22550 [Vibrio chemaguriensis]
MLEPVFSFLERLATEFSWRKLILVIAIAVVVVVTIAVYEQYTGHFELSKLEKVITLTEKIAKAEELAKTNEELKVVLSLTTNELKGLVKAESSGVELTQTQKKGLFAFLPWFILMAAGSIFARQGRMKGVTGIFLFSIPFSIIGAYIPTFSNVYINYHVIPWSAFIVSIALIVAYQRRKQQN